MLDALLGLAAYIPEGPT